MHRNYHIPYDPSLKEKARDLRKNQTYSEKILWNAIRRRELGYEFHRQVPMLNYIADFYCHELRLAIEIDGISHDTDHAKLYDKERQYLLENAGVRFLRFRDELVKEDPDRVVNEIEAWIKANKK
ncbi:endonuclease domain-containing protein [candidate division KSB1 bacterium]|nr:endonuclease domain-containing protein [candidate division KSB1 bacterium]